MTRRLLTIFMLVVAVSRVFGTEVSGTLPVVYIITDQGQQITSRDEDIPGVYWLDPIGKSDAEAIGSADNPLPLYIRGRGNYTWSKFDKKSYHIKLWRKQSLLGMNKGKHFALLGHPDDNIGFLRNTVGFELSRRMGFPFTPEQRPVELVLNGEYIGLYFLTETVRADENRVEIDVQQNGETRPEAVTGGWLVEIDNNETNHQFELPVTGTDLQKLWITYHSPDSLSAVQRDYLYQQFMAILEAVYTQDKSSTRWEELIDVETLARFYVLNEVLDHLEAFIGSCYLYKNHDEKKWHFGPVWDFGHAFNNTHSKQQYIYNYTRFPPSIIKELAKFPRFQQAVARVWDEFYPARLAGLEDFMNTFLDEIADAATADAECWPKYGNANVRQSASVAFTRLHSKVKWLESQWRPIILSVESTLADHATTTALYDLCGRRVKNSTRHVGLYLQLQRDATGRQVAKKVIRGPGFD